MNARDELSDPVISNPWQALRRFTAARIALGRAGGSLPTQAHLAFQLAHAQARDAVHAVLDTAELSASLAAAGYASIAVHSAAQDRSSYLQRPDLGRRLAVASRVELESFRAAQCGSQDHDGRFDIAFVIADGLSALAVQRHAVALVDACGARLRDGGWRIAPVAIVRQGRVAVGDEVGEILQARIVVVLIGERPGLSSPDSLGIYFTHDPHVGCVDAQRNCISNVRPEGLPVPAAADKLCYLLGEARRRQISGVALKDEADGAEQLLDSRNFLIGA